MKLLRGFEGSADFRGGFVAIGNFDGVHRGHQSMVAMLVNRARAAGVPAVVLTFDPHPIELLRPQQAPPSLSTLEHKAALLGAGGVDVVIAYPTDWELLNLTPAEFFEKIVVQRLAARGLVEGPNFFFGKNRAGNVATLEQLCAASGRTLDVVPPFQVGDQLVSSSAVRQEISQGNLAAAVEMLGHPYRLHGTVVRGSERGRTLGFPTANVSEIKTLIPADGVYAGSAGLGGQTHAAAINIGPNPTFGETRRKVEAHIIGFTGDLYGQELDIDLLERLRETRPFSGVEQLRAQLEADVAQAKLVVERKL